MAGLCLESRLMWPLRGEAYHQVMRSCGAVNPSDSRVLIISAPSSASRFVQSAMSRFTSATCSKISNAVIRSNLPDVSSAMAGIRRGIMRDGLPARWSRAAQRPAAAAAIQVVYG
jgi:hypothetical protein